jgi:uncharacterized protein
MRLGANITRNANFKMAEVFNRSGHLDFYELLLDNFLHLEPAQIRRRIGDTPVSFHIMGSRFMDRDESQLAVMAERIRHFTAALEPLYVSDHILRWTLGGQLMSDAIEIEYDDESNLRRVAKWTEMLGCQVKFENFASCSQEGAGQLDFFRAMKAELGVEPLFDYSNAVVAELNGATPAVEWIESELDLTTSHVSGFRMTDGSLYIDSHDVKVGEESWELIRSADSIGKGPATLVIERDGVVDQDEWESDFRFARSAVPAR